MSEDTPNLVLEHLRAIRTELHEIREEQREQRGGLGSIERSISYMTREIAEMGLRLDGEQLKLLGRHVRVQKPLAGKHALGQQS